MRTASAHGPQVATCDLCDVYKNDESGQFRVLPPVFPSFGGVESFAGPAFTVKCFEDNSLVKAAVDSPGQGRVLWWMEAARCAVRWWAAIWQQQPPATAGRGWWCMVPCVMWPSCVPPPWAYALAPMPLPTEKRNEGQSGVAVQLAGVTVRPGDWVYADADGVVVADRAIHPGA
jgi:regulator of ribonuclease activity A